MNSPLFVRAARLDDADVLTDYNLLMARETESLELDRTIVLPGVRAALADPNKAIYFVAEIDAQVIGQLMITHEWSDWRNGDIWWIQSVYVHPDHRNRGAFKALYRHVEQQAISAGAVGLRLYVEQQNETAQRAYARLGMHMGHYRVMEVMFADAETP